MKLTMQDWSNIGISYGETVDIKGAIDEYVSFSLCHSLGLFFANACLRPALHRDSYQTEMLS